MKEEEITNMTIDEIYKSKWFNNMIDEVIRMNNDNSYLKNDLKSEIILILCERPKLLSVSNIKGMVWRIIKNQYMSKSSPFHKKYRETIRSNVDVEYVEKETDTNEIENLHNKLLRLHPAETILIKMYYKMDEFGIDGKYENNLKSKNDISRINKLTGIPKRIIEKEINSIIEKLRKMK
jgi:hypothetical protein